MTYTDSDPVGGTLILAGVWIHDPMDPDATARHYPYGGPATEGRTEVASVSAHYAGREFPVTDFGPQQRQGLQVSVTVPHGPLWAQQWADLLALPAKRRPQVFRDGRGRNIRGTITAMRDRDQAWGTLAQFDVERV